MFLISISPSLTLTAFGQPPFESTLLTGTDDLSVLMVQGIDRYLTLKTQELKQERHNYWKYDFSSAQSFERSTQQNRDLLSERLGIADKRASPDLEILTTKSLKQLKIDNKESILYSVRWKVLDNLWAEGILILPKQKIAARVIMIPDADIVPEVLAGFKNLRGAGWGSALRLAKAGCQVLIPTLVNRQDTFSGSEILNHFTNQPHREWLYRQSYELGRHIIGYELQKIFAAIDWFQSEDHTQESKVPIGVAGYGEGGMLALYAAAIDRRITCTIVSGYYNEREQLWSEPIYRNVFGLLKTFGDAELAVMAWPNKVIIEHCKEPVVGGPPQSTNIRFGAAPGKLDSLSFSSAFSEWEKAKNNIPASKNHLLFVKSKSGLGDHPFSDTVLSLFAEQLKVQKTVSPLSSNENVYNNDWVNETERQKKTVRDIEMCVQRTLALCSKTRDQSFWNTLSGDISSQDKIKAIHRKRFADILGFLSPQPSEMLPKARKLNETEKWTSYEITLNVLPDVFAWGIIMIPKNIPPGEKRPVVVCQHGLEGLPGDVVTTDSTAQNFHYYKGLATRLTERGYITFCPHNPYRGKDNFRVLQRKANPIGLTLFSIITAQHQRIVDWLSSLSFVDSTRIALYGLSYGGKTAMRVPVLVKGYCLSICSGDFNEWVLKNATTAYDFSYLFTREYEMPEWDLGHTFNYAEMAALIAPRPFMVERGIYDGVATDEWVDFEFAKVRRHYMNLGIQQLCAIEHFPGPHTINGVGTFEFLDKYLKRNWIEK